ncbi:ENHANCED DISEASE RESISTANCE 2 [Spatholobus suberectus]|nr:ENHANCED DISEASE RESISTANCE 2 [Spatholobus suberectus]
MYCINTPSLPTIKFQRYLKTCITNKPLDGILIYNASNQRDQLKLGARSSEDAAEWIRSLQDAALKFCLTRMGGSKRTNWKHSAEWDFQSSIYTEAMTSDVNAPSPWKIFGCHNGLRMFKEAEDWDSHRSHWGSHPVMMAVGVVDGTSEAIFHTLMSLGSSRSEWDFCIYQGSVVDHIDGHTDIIHMKLYNDWLPWGMKPRDFLLRRYWRREVDGTYVLLFHSVYHKKCPPQRGYVRATLKSGGFLVTPFNKGKQSLVKHMLAIDWKFCKLYLGPSSARSITICMLEKIAALRELFKTKAGNDSSEPNEIAIDIVLPKENIESEVTEENSKVGELVLEEEAKAETSRRTSLMGLNDSDEFFDLSEPMDYDEFENEWHSASLQNSTPWYLFLAKILPSWTHNFLKVVPKICFAVQKKGYMDLHEISRENSVPCPYGATLQKESTYTSPCSWGESDPSLFLIRGKTYLKDHQKVKAKRTLMQMVGADWFRSDTREDDLCSCPGSIVQMPATPLYSIGLYYMMRTPLEDNPLLHGFVR